MARHIQDTAMIRTTTTTPPLFVTFPNVRIVQSNVEDIVVDTVVDIVLYEQYFAVVLVSSKTSSNNSNLNVVMKKFGCPQSVIMKDDKEYTVQVHMWDGYLLGFEVKQRCQAWLCQEFKQLQT